MWRLLFSRKKASLVSVLTFLIGQIALGGAQGGGGGGGCGFPFFALRRSLPHPGGDPAPAAAPAPAPSPKAGRLEFSLQGQDDETTVPASPEGIINLGTLPKGKVLDHVIIV
ncbi:MAG: hypothetical protein AAB425_03515, partial [Bdellovibrionota bacterium]